MILALICPACETPGNAQIHRDDKLSLHPGCDCTLQGEHIRAFGDQIVEAYQRFNVATANTETLLTSGGIRGN